MKKSFKRFLALLLAVIMMMAMWATVFAATPNNGANENGGKTTVAVTENGRTQGTLNVNTPTEGATYTAYKLFSATLGNGDTYTWQAEEVWKSALGAETAETIAAKDASELKILASTLASDDNLSGKTGTTVTASSTELNLGYYLVVETNTEGLEKSQPILVAIPQVQNNAWVYDISITPKSSTTGFDKKIAEDGTLVETNTKNIGEYVDYRLIADIPTYEESAYTDGREMIFKITDRMSSQLTWGNESQITVYVADSTVLDESIASLTGLTEIVQTNNYTVTPPAENTKGGNFTVDFTKSFLRTNKGRKVIVAFSAMLNEDAVIGADSNGAGNPNDATLTYSNSYYAGGETDEIKGHVTTFTFDLKTEKVDADNTDTKLGGAEFTVYTDPSCTDAKKYFNTSEGFKNPLVTGDGKNGTTLGQVTAKGFDEGTYYLKETKAPAGYQQYDGVIKVEIVAEKKGEKHNGNFSYTIDLGSYNEQTNEWEPAAEKTELTNQSIVTVKDKKGLTLPGTGGIGSTIFTFGGIVLVVLAAVLFIAYTRKQKKQS